MSASSTDGQESHSQINPTIPKTSSSVQHRFSAPNFGSRFLTDDKDVFSHNAWDHVPPPTDQDERIIQAITRQRHAPVSEADRAKYNGNPARHWDIFYKNNENNFFRDRNWLHLEFPELIATTKPDAGSTTIFEVGCGAGNTIFPLLSTNQNPNLSIVACDFSPRAVKLVQSHPLYASPPAGRISAAVWDITSSNLPPNVSPSSVDFILMIFVLSALHPNEWRQAITNLYTILKPGGRILMRDYGRYDLAQLRFKEGRLLADNFYIRGDKTRVYFFSLDDLANIFTGSPMSDLTQVNTTTTTVESDETVSGDATPSVTTPPVEVDAQMPLTTIQKVTNSGLKPNGMTETNSPSSGAILSTPEVSEDIVHPSPDPSSLQHPLFLIEQLGVDNRLLVNRKRQLKMHRVWMQGKFDKIPQKQSSQDYSV